MGEEKNQPEEKKPMEEKKDESPKTENEKPIEEKKPKEDSKEAAAAAAAPPPPPPPQPIVLKVFMHCEGCARKVRRCLKGFEGVEDVETNCITHKVVVKGEKADPLKVLERVQRKSHSPVELLSPLPPPKPPLEEPKKVEEVVKVEEKKQEPQVIMVVLGVHMHCEACAQEIRKRIQKMKGVESAEPDLKSSQVTVKGVFEPPKLVEFVRKKTGKLAVIVKVEPVKKEEEKPKEGKEEKKGEEGEKEAKKGKEDGKEKKEGGGDGGNAGGEEAPKAAATAEPEQKQQQQEEDPKTELKKNEFLLYQPENINQVYPQRYVQEMHAYPPQIFSDENPNACSVM